MDGALERIFVGSPTSLTSISLSYTGNIRSLAVLSSHCSDNLADCRSARSVFPSVATYFGVGCNPWSCCKRCSPLDNGFLRRKDVNHGSRYDGGMDCQLDIPTHGRIDGGWGIFPSFFGRDYLLHLSTMERD